jgi:hypothetical protein
MDKAYKEDIPKYRRALEDLREKFAGIVTKTDWIALRIEPLLQHVKHLEGVLRSPQFSRELTRLRHGVAMFHADLVYVRENIKGLKAILTREKTGLQARERRVRPPTGS